MLYSNTLDSYTGHAFGICDECGNFLTDCCCLHYSSDDAELTAYYDDLDFRGTYDDDSVVDMPVYASTQPVLFIAKTHTSYKSLSNVVSASKYTINTTDVGASVSIIAPHGGTIEPGTTQLAVLIARNDYNFYSFTGVGKNTDSLHITSHLFDEPECVELVEQSTTVISVHGCAGDKQYILIGGLHKRLRNKLASCLSVAGFDARATGHKFPARHKDNICNKGTTSKGVQIELSRGLRDDSASLNHIADVIRFVLTTIKS